MALWDACRNQKTAFYCKISIVSSSLEILFYSLLVQIHDELLYEVHDSQLDEARGKRGKLISRCGLFQNSLTNSVIDSINMEDIQQSITQRSVEKLHWGMWLICPIQTIGEEIRNRALYLQFELNIVCMYI